MFRCASSDLVSKLYILWILAGWGGVDRGLDIILGVGFNQTEQSGDVSEVDVGPRERGREREREREREVALFCFLFIWEGNGDARRVFGIAERKMTCQTCYGGRSGPGKERSRQLTVRAPMGTIYGLLYCLPRARQHRIILGPSVSGVGRVGSSRPSLS